MQKIPATYLQYFWFLKSFSYKAFQFPFLIPYMCIGKGGGIPLPDFYDPPLPENFQKVDFLLNNGFIFTFFHFYPLSWR